MNKTLLSAAMAGIIVAGSIRQAQLVALTLLLISLWLMRQWYQPLDKPGKEQYAKK